MFLFLWVGKKSPGILIKFTLVELTAISHLEAEP